MAKKSTTAPAGVKSNEAVWGSDVVAAAIAEQDFPYICLNPGASYRGLHDSIVNHLGNRNPKMLVCLHEEHAVAIAQGYAKVTNKPLAVALHANIGLMHATMAIFNAWCGRLPMLILGATGPVDAELRRPWIDWVHTSADQGALVRNYSKWDDQPGSPAAAADSVRRATMIARTAPMGPVYVNLDAAIQEMALDEWPEFHPVSLFQPPPPPQPRDEDLTATLALLGTAENPYILAGRVTRSEQGWADRVRLAEALNAKVISSAGEAASFPTTHPLFAGETSFVLRGPLADELKAADAILSLDWTDLGGTLRQLWPGGSAVPAVISCTMDFQVHNGWSMDYQALAPANLRIATTPETFVSALLPRLDVNSGQPATDRVAPMPAVEPGASGAIGVADLVAVFAQASAEKDVTLITRTIGWPLNSNIFEHPLDYLGGSDGAGLGAGPGNAIGSALAIRDLGNGRVPIALLGDGDYLMGVNALWTAAREEIPLLIIVANNRSYFNDELHQERVARQRGRPVENRWIGQRIADPAPDLAGLARAQGLEGAGPIGDLADLPAAIEEAINRVKAGAAYVLDVVVTPEYVTSSVHDRKG